MLTSLRSQSGEMGSPSLTRDCRWGLLGVSGGLSRLTMCNNWDYWGYYVADRVYEPAYSVSPDPPNGV